MQCPLHHSMPENAAFCPTCGAPAAPFNAAVCEDFEARAQLDVEDGSEFRVTRPFWPWLAAALAGLALAGGMWMAVSPTPEPAVAMVVAEVADEAPPIKVDAPEIFNAEALRIEASNVAHQITYHGVPLVDLRTARGSRYETLAERSNAVWLRLGHAWQTSADAHSRPIFTARANGPAYEVVWTRPDGTAFRILDVTPQDVTAWEKSNGKTTAAILANLLADRLTGLSDHTPNS